MFNLVIAVVLISTLVEIMKRVFICFVLCLACTGCSSWNSSKKTASAKKFNWTSPKTWFEKEYQQPTSLAAIWSPDVLVTSGQGSTRGFGGRIYFYNERSQAIPVDGDLIVHGYEAVGNAQERQQASLKRTADKVMKFSGEELKTHFSPSQLGASYSVWIPWEDADGVRKEITLIPSFKSKDGKVVQGSSAKLYLPGTEIDEQGQRRIPAQQISYRRSSIATNPGSHAVDDEPRMRTTTIEVPGNASLANTVRTSESYTLGNGRTKPAQSISTSNGGLVVGQPIGRTNGTKRSGRRTTFELNGSSSSENKSLQRALQSIQRLDAQPAATPSSPGVVSLPTIPKDLPWEAPIGVSSVQPASYQTK